MTRLQDVSLTLYGCNNINNNTSDTVLVQAYIKSNNCVPRFWLPLIISRLNAFCLGQDVSCKSHCNSGKNWRVNFIYLVFYITPTISLVILWRVVLLPEETSTHSWSRFCTVNCQPMVSNYQLSPHEVGPGLERCSWRGWRCHHGPQTQIWDKKTRMIFSRDFKPLVTGSMVNKTSLLRLF